MVYKNVHQLYIPRHENSSRTTLTFTLARGKYEKRGGVEGKCIKTGNTSRYRDQSEFSPNYNWLNVPFPAISNLALSRAHARSSSESV